MGILQCCRDTLKNEEETIPASLNNHPNSSLASFSLYKTFLKSLTDNKYYLHIHIGDLELYFKHWDNFGLVFHPMITLSIPSKEKQLINLPIDINNKINLSSISRISDSSSNTIDLTTTIIGINNRPEYKKTFYFEYDKSFTLDKETLFDYINITIQNKAWTSKQEDLCIIGEAKIPIDLITNTKGVNNFGGHMAINHRGLGYIGQLLVNININSLHNFFEVKEDFSKSHVLLNIENDNNEPKDQNLNIRYPYEDTILHFYHIHNHQLLTDFDIHNEDIIEAAIAFILECEKNEEIDKKYISGQYELYLTNGNILIAYELFIYLSKLLNNQNKADEVFDLIKLITIEKLIEFPSDCNYNLITLKAFLVFLYQYIKYCKHNNTMNNSTHTILITILVKLIKYKNNNKSFSEDDNSNENHNDDIFSPTELHMSDFNTRILFDNCQYCLNAICDSLAFSNFNFKSPYVLCNILIDNLTIFTSYISLFICNSNIVFTVIRLIRKILEIISNKSEVMKLDIVYQTTCEELKRKMINSQTNLIEHLSKTIEHYYHIPELMSNILQILVELSSNVSKASIISLYNQMNFDLFSHKFLFYRTKLKYINKSLNQLYLELLYNFSIMIKDDHFEDIEQVLKKDTFTIDTIEGIDSFFLDKHESIAKEVLFFYQMTKKHNEFLNKKILFIYLNEIMSSIGYNLSLLSKTAYMLTNCYFYNDCVCFLMKLSKINNSFIECAIEKNTKTMTKERVMDCIQNTVENILRILLITLLSSQNDLSMKIISCKETGDFFDDYKIIKEDIIKCLKDKRIKLNTIEILLDLFDVNYIQANNSNKSNGYKEENGESNSIKIVENNSKEKSSKEKSSIKKGQFIKKKTDLLSVSSKNVINKKKEKNEEDERKEEDKEIEDGDEEEKDEEEDKQEEEEAEAEANSINN